MVFNLKVLRSFSRELNQVLIAFEESERLLHSRSTLPSLDR